MLVEAQVPSSLPNASEFEILSAAAALVFHSQPVDVAIVEIGLGGLFDSTNACEPAVSVLTSVGLDHTEFLGSTLEAIARDKAYISRRNQPLVVGELSPNALQAASETTRITGARIAHYNTLSRRWDCVFHEIMNRANSWISANAQNLCVALKALEEFEVQIQSPLCTSDIVSGVLHTVWPGRFDERTVGNRTFVFDGAHNEQGFHFFEKQFAQSEYSQTKPLFIYASLSDKPWQVIIPNLHRLASRIIFTEVRSERAVQAQNLLKFATERLPKHHHSHAPNVREALAMALAAPTTAPIFIVGSLALVGEAMENLSVDPFEKLRGHA
jgi:dihydrofolate synthase/folylpolyglutamate synthase